MRTRVAALEKLFKALADETRLRILSLLLTGEVCVCQIHESLRIPQPKASRHLAYLRRAGLVATRRDGLWVHYRLAELPDSTLQIVLRATQQALPRLDTVERDLGRLHQRTGCCLPAGRAEAATPRTGRPKACATSRAGRAEALGYVENGQGYVFDALLEG